MDQSFDVIVLGTGNAGLAAAREARQAGLSVAVAERRDVGGTCPLRGCVPKKVLVAATAVLDQIARAPAHHIAVGPARLDWPALIRRERGFTEGVPEELEAVLEKRGITLFRGAARFLAPDRVAVGEARLAARRIVIATGSVPRALDVPGAEHLLTSDDLLFLDALPESLVFVGGGVIALELGHVFHRAGSKVTILELAPRLLPRADPDLADRLRAETERLGIRVLTGVAVRGIARDGRGMRVDFVAEDGTAESVPASVVANGAGRVPAIADLDLARAGLEAEGGRIATDAQLRARGAPHIYVVGDARSAAPQLSPIATYEGTIAGRNIAGGDREAVDLTGIPFAVYTLPTLAQVGLTEAEAREAGLEAEVHANDMEGWRSTRTYAEPVAFAKVLTERGTDRLLGAHILGHGAEEVIHLFGLAMRHGLKAQALRDFVYAYPTFGSDTKFLL
jgi:glutathione reductase (NADPH)